MHDKEHLVNEHVKEYESRQLHVDELLQRAEQHVADQPELEEDLNTIKSRHDEMVSHVHDFRQGKVDEQAIKAIETAGPMGIWYGLISELETLIEGLKK